MSTAAAGADLGAQNSDNWSAEKCAEFVRVKEIAERARAGDLIMRFPEQRTDRAHRRFLEAVSKLTKLRSVWKLQNKKSTKDQEPCRAPRKISRNGDVAVVAINRLAGLWATEPCLVENDHE